MLEFARELHSAGLGLLWLAPQSKRPIDQKWTGQKRKSWEELRAQYRPGMNLGVRLGAVSRYGGGYLAAIDCDLKSDDRRFQKEMVDSLKSLIPEIGAAPCVLSGRGNGSRHYYVITERPIRSKTLAKSTEKVEVYMPSVKPSEAEKAALPPARLNSGYRLRPAWEISLMGEGRQCVLPPSVHPDTKRQYNWKTPLDRIIRIDWDDTAEAAPVAEMPLDLEADFEGEETPEEAEKLINGENVEDRSAAMFRAAIILLRSGMGRGEIAKRLSDPKTYLGRAAFEHAKTRDRKKAAAWVLKYTVEKAAREIDPAKDFLGELPPDLTAEGAAEQAAEIELITGEDWEKRLERTAPKAGAKIKPTLFNILLILENAVAPDIIRRNEFSLIDFYSSETPWGGRPGAEIRDQCSINIKRWLAERWRFEPPRMVIEEAMQSIASRNAFHPVRDYLNSLRWDGVERIDNWLVEYLGAEGEPDYLRAISRKVLVAMVARIFRPGEKFDQVLILKGNQGVGKSTTLRNLAGPEWFSDAKLNLHDKDAVLGMQGVWLREIGELSGMRRADVEDLKSFISQGTDRIRVPYGRRTEAFPRQSIFIGSTNRDDFLRDETGNRRFWPVTVGDCDFEGIARDRDQLFAEAVTEFHLGEPLYLESREAQAQAGRAQAQFMEDDLVMEAIIEFLEKDAKKPENERFPINRFKLGDMQQNVAACSSSGAFCSTQKVAAALRKLGFIKFQAREKGGIGPIRYWGR